MHNLLARQIKQRLGDVDVETLSDDWKKLIAAINDTYYHMDETRALLTRSLDISSREHEKLYQILRNQKQFANKKDVAEIENSKRVEQEQELAVLESEIAGISG